MNLGFQLGIMSSTGSNEDGKKCSSSDTLRKQIIVDLLSSLAYKHNDMHIYMYFICIEVK